ncbi:MAG TPA: histidine--tRNA ligase [Kofleriaceae bacterium]|nr:histidine--tRNA ligase [Kofleriaceae bacterium]
MPVQPRTTQGVLELLPAQQIAFQRMLDTIRRNFELFGFLPVETPVFELTDVLLTKSGGETEKQVYFVQSTGSLKQGDTPELALRFDLTVPLARYVAQHEHQLNFPFRRYQIQRVYRGERAQKGRFREFYQCDIDVIGKDTLPLAYDAEVPALIHSIFKQLDFGPFTIFINNRKLLRGLLESLGIAIDKHPDVLNQVDRLGKQEREQIEAKITEHCDAETSKRLLDLLTMHPGDSRSAIAALHTFEPANANFKEGLRELEDVYNRTLALGVPPAALQINLSIARGLDYYTGTIYETFLTDHPKLGSICSGGRYADLAGFYTKSKLPGVGISIGATRLFSQLLELNLVKVDRPSTAQVVILNVEPALAEDYLHMAASLRSAGINTEVYGGDDKLGKQMKYADRSGAPIGVLVGSRERDANQVKLKLFRENREIDVPRSELLGQIQKLLTPA